MASFSSPLPALFTAEAFRQFLEDFAEKVTRNENVLISFDLQHSERGGETICWELAIQIHEGEPVTDYKQFMKEGEEYLKRLNSGIAESLRAAMGRDNAVPLGKPYPKDHGKG